MWSVDKATGASSSTQQYADNTQHDKLCFLVSCLLYYLLPASQTSVQQVGELTRLVRSDVSSLARRLLAALITIDVHSRDIVSALLSKGTSSTQDFEWQMQLRYYWEDDDSLVVRQVGWVVRVGR